MLYADTIETALPTKSSTCPHCSAGNPEYPPISVKIMPVKGRKKDDVSQILQMEIELSEKRPFDLAYDFWAFIEGATKEYEIDAEVPHKRILLPSEVHSFCKLLNEIFCMAVVHLLAMYIICLSKYQVPGLAEVLNNYSNCCLLQLTICCLLLQNNVWCIWTCYHFQLFTLRSCVSQFISSKQ